MSNNPTLMLPFAALLVAAGWTAQAQTWNQNLIVNGDAESGSAMAGSDAAAVKQIPGWTTTGGLTVMQYDGDGYDNMQSTYDGPVDRGKNYFVGGMGTGTSSAVQTIDLSPFAAAIDGGNVRFYLSGYIGLGSESSKIAMLTATFKDSSGKALLTATVKGPNSIEVDYLSVRATSGFLLPNTRQVDVQIDLTANRVLDDGFNDTPADNLSLMLTQESVLGKNLVVNGDAETAPGKDGGMNYDLPLPGWNAYNSRGDGIRAASYTDLGVPYDPTAGNPGHLFENYSGDPTGTDAIAQTIDVTLAKDRIDAGSVSFHLQADLGGDGGQWEGMASVNAEFLDGSGAVLSKSTVGPVGAADLGGNPGLLTRSLDGQVPPNTRSILVMLQFAQLSNDGSTTYADNINLVLSSGSGPVSLNSILNGGSGVTGPVAPGEAVMLLVSGVNLSATTNLQLDGSGNIATTLSNVTVYFDGWKAPLLDVNSSQIGAMVPFEIDGQTSSVVHVEYQGVKSNSVTVNVAPAAPGILPGQSGSPSGMIFDSKWAPVSNTNPAAKGSTVSIVFTGAGQTTPPGIDGHIEDFAQDVPKLPVSVTIDGQPATLLYAGTIPLCWDGISMAQVQVPSAARTGVAVPVVITEGSASSPATGANIWVK